MAEPIPEDEYEIVMRFAKRSIDRLESLPPGWVADLLQLLAEAEAERDALRTALEAAEARAVPEGWKVEWGGVWHPTDGEDFTLTAGYYTDRPYLVPLSPTDTPEEA